MGYPGVDIPGANALEESSHFYLSTFILGVPTMCLEHEWAKA